MRELWRGFNNMSIHRYLDWIGRARLGRRVLVGVISLGLLFAAGPLGLAAYPGAQEPAPAPPPAKDLPDQVQAQTPDQQAAAAAPAYTQQTAEQLQQLVAPVALYPDSLVAQILAAATYPEQVVEADRFLQAHPDLKGEELAKTVDQQAWDPSVKALAAFPSVLGNMDKNLSWTSSLGDAYYNQQQDVMDAVQVMREKAQAAGNLKSTPQQTVKADGPSIEIEPADPQVVYVPAYDPWAIYGYPIAPWPFWYPYPGIWYEGPYLSFGVGFGIGFYGGFGWGWGNWGFDWHNRYAIYNHDRYFSRSRTFYNRNAFYRGGAGRGGVRPGETRGPGGRAGQAGRPGEARGGGFDRPSAAPRPFGGDNRAARGFAPPRGQSGTRSGAFSGIGRGGETRGYSSRGSASMGGGARGGGGGARSGGGGGRHR